MNIYKHVTGSRMKSAESTKASYDKDVEKSSKNTADHSRACYYKHLEKSKEDTTECSKMWMCHSVALLLL